LFGGELSSVIQLKPKQGAQILGLFRDIHCEFEKHEKLAVEMIRHQLRLLMVHLSRIYAATSPAPFAAISLVRRFRQSVESSFRATTSVRDYAHALQFKAPFNEIKNEARVFTYEDTSIVTPNSDTPYSFLWMDLRAEPLVISVPAVKKSRYYVVQLEDGNNFNYGYIGSRTTGNDAGDYMVVGPDWKGQTPPGIKKVFQSSTQFSVCGFRTQLFNPEDMPNVVKVQAGYKAQTLSAYLKQPAPPPAPAVNFPKVDKTLMKTNFFELLEFVLQLGVAGPEEKEILAKLARIGVGPGKKFDFKDLPPEQKAAAGEGMEAGDAKVDEFAAKIGKRINNWNVCTTPSATAITLRGTGCCAPLARRSAFTLNTSRK
jgi:hypothetical protein